MPSRIILCQYKVITIVKFHDKITAQIQRLIIVLQATCITVMILVVRLRPLSCVGISWFPSRQPAYMRGCPPCIP